MAPTGPSASPGAGNGTILKVLLAGVVLAVVVLAGPKVLDAVNGDQCRDVASMSYDEQIDATRQVLDNSMVDYGDEDPEMWRGELLSYCASNPDDDLDDIAPYGW